MGRYRLAYRHLRGRPLRTGLTVAALAFSVGLLGLLVALNDAFKRDLSPYSASRVVVIPKTSMFDKLPMAYQAKIEAVPGVARVLPFDFLMAAYRDERPENQVPISSAPPDELVDVYREANVPPAELKEWIADPRGALVGRILVKKYGWKLGDRVVLKAPVKGNVVEVTIRAVMRYDLDNGVYIHRRYFEGLTGNEGQAGMFWILAKSKDDVVPVTLALEKAFDNAPEPVQAMSERQWQLYWFQMLGNVKALIGGIGLVIAFTLLLITSNTLAMGARERRGEAALLRILGFTRGAVSRLLFMEAGVYGLLGGALGTALVYGFSVLLGKAMEETPLSWLGALLVPTAFTLTLSFLISLSIALGAGVVPAIGVARRSIVQLLREG